MSDFILKGGIWETEREVPLFQANLKIYVMQEDNGSPTQRQREIFESLNRLPERLLDDIATHARSYYRQVDSIVNLSQEGRVIDDSNIEKHYTVKSILIPEIRNCNLDYLFISTDCDWEEEHGMQFLIENACVIACGEHSSLPFSLLWKNIISASEETRIELLKQYRMN